eukprot:CAMPEP_0172747520 /NCGR_PEP_ID=MMETSP1074-20121228/142956_1 /TAXON_ID=2916 /ORGANISM="Ceratium fusus, Strain PA161109" /LENGTH=34 /DNA_ID= /DNA_START= /DNA_END= /DNA_ORIENTATION=
MKPKRLQAKLTQKLEHIQNMPHLVHERFRRIGPR